MMVFPKKVKWMFIAFSLFIVGYLVGAMAAKLLFYYDVFNSGPKAWRPEPKSPVDAMILAPLINGLRFDYGGPGDYGAEVVLTESEKEEANRTFALNQFNLVASEQVSINRRLVDYRSSQCISEAEERATSLGPLPSTSIVIIFHNEARSTLLRTLHSIINRTPQSSLIEILLVDDASNNTFLKKPLNLYASYFPIPLHVVHLKERSGLVRARLEGAKRSTGKVLVFLDAHVEVTTGWLEPLLHRIMINKQTVVSPVIDSIADNDFGYSVVAESVGGFGWNLEFKWSEPPRKVTEKRSRRLSEPLKTPTMAGGLFAIDRNYFFDVGAYDKEMKIWGAENVEMSLRIWQCGGQLEIHPCSRVGHIYRKHSPHFFPDGVSKTIYRNMARVANVWMDDYRIFFYAMAPEVQTYNLGNLKERQELRSRLKCKSFRWYLNNVYPESSFPSCYQFLGQIVSVSSNQCLALTSDAEPSIHLSNCSGETWNQMWVFTSSGEIRNNKFCLIVERGMSTFWSSRFGITKCLGNEMDKQYRFDFDIPTQQLSSQHTKECLKTGELANDGHRSLVLADCSKIENGTLLQWTFNDFALKLN